MDIINKTKLLRDEAWQAVLASADYRAYKSLDDALKTMTGEESMVLRLDGLPSPRNVNAGVVKNKLSARITQGDVAARVLKGHGKPLPIGRWLEKSVADGINIKGEDPLANFRSTVSRDKRFYALVRNSMYFWWFTDVGLPIGLQIIGRRHDDLGVLRVAQTWEQIRAPLRPWPQPP